MYQIDSNTIKKLRDDGHDVWTISLWENWLAKMAELKLLVTKIRNSFESVTLGDGIGLREADMIDSCGSNEERQSARDLDEKDCWRNIGADVLNSCYVSPGYLDARGFLFHLPAFLIAELTDEFDFGFIDRLVESKPRSTDWIALLDNVQSDAVIETLMLVKQHPEYHNRGDAFDRAVERISNRNV